LFCSEIIIGETTATVVSNIAKRTRPFLVAPYRKKKIWWLPIINSKCFCESLDRLTNKELRPHVKIVVDKQARGLRHSTDILYSSAKHVEFVKS
jgi:hypothetical protein